MDLPLEALAFRYSAALSGSAWPLLAVAFAAVGLWRIRTIGSKPSLLQNPIPAKAASVPVSEKPTEPPNDKLTVVGLPSYRHVESDGVSFDVKTKGRFTAYFYAESDGDSEEVDGVWESHEEEAPALGRWEEVRGDLGWYRYVDLTAIDGSVVRLWGRDHGGVRRRGIGVEW